MGIYYVKIGFRILTTIFTKTALPKKITPVWRLISCSCGHRKINDEQQGYGENDYICQKNRVTDISVLLDSARDLGIQIALSPLLSLSESPGIEKASNQNPCTCQ
jgi:hypothetical protein